MASNKDSSSQVIIVKKYNRHAGHHGGSWKVAYADFVTAMMAFFLVMWIVGQSQAIKENVSSYFTDPVAYSAKIKSGLLGGSSGIMDEAGSEYSVLEKNNIIVNEQIKALLEQAGKEIAKEILESPDLEDLSNSITIEVTSEGLRIELEEASESDSTFFDLGSAKLSASGQTVLETIGKTIAELDMDIAVEGHTDSSPYNSGDGGYTNWELSADRANSARRVLTAAGVSSDHVAGVRGYADTLLKYPDNPLDPRNRRITIIVLNNLMVETTPEAGAEETPEDIGVVETPVEIPEYPFSNE